MNKLAMSGATYGIKTILSSLPYLTPSSLSSFVLWVFQSPFDHLKEQFFK